MKIITSAVFTALACLAAAPALAQAPAAPMTAVATTPPAKFSVDGTPIETLAANPATKAVLDKDLPGLTSHPMYDQFKGMTLTALVPMSQGQLTDDQVKTVQADLDKIN